MVIMDKKKILAIQTRCFKETMVWKNDNYQLTQYIIDDEKSLEVSKFECEYRATRREEMTDMFLSTGCTEVVWKFPEETGFYQPIVIVRKQAK